MVWGGTELQLLLSAEQPVVWLILPFSKEKEGKVFVKDVVGF